MWREQNFKYIKFGLIMGKPRLNYTKNKNLAGNRIIWRTPLGPLKGSKWAKGPQHTIYLGKGNTLKKYF